MEYSIQEKVIIELVRQQTQIVFTDEQWSKILADAEKIVIKN